jgi:cytochrome P450
VTLAAASDLVFDPYDWDTRVDPYPLYRRMRDEAPVSYNERLDYYAITRFDDYERMLLDKNTFISVRGTTLDMIQAGTPMPPGLFITEDPPRHTRHRAIVSRLFTPKHVTSLEEPARRFCRKVLDDLAGATTFDFMGDLASLVPMQVIGMLLGIPEADQQALRLKFEETMQGAYADAKGLEASMAPAMAVFGDYLEWREKNPSDDLMTELLTLEFTDEEGTTRRLTRQELCTYLLLIASAGGDTTSRLLGWAGQLLGDHPDARRAVVADPALLPNAIEEAMRYEPPSYQVARYVTRDVEFHGQVVPEGSALVALPGAANRDDRAFPDADTFDIHRRFGHHLSFGYGAHFCLGASLARLEARIVLEEVLQRYPDWEVDHDNARLTPGYLTRGYGTLPVVVG